MYLILFHTAHPCGVPDIVSHYRVLDIVSHSRTKLLPSTGHENNTAQPKPDNRLSSTIVHRLTVVYVWFCTSLILGITPKIRMLCFVLINSALFKLLCLYHVPDKQPTPPVYLTLFYTVHNSRVPDIIPNIRLSAPHGFDDRMAGQQSLPGVRPQNVCQHGSSFTWPQPCNNQTTL